MRKLAGIFSAVVVALAGALLAPAAPAAADGPVPGDGPYRIGDPAGETFVLAIAPILTTRVSMTGPLDPTDPSYLRQQWHLEDAGSGTVTIVRVEPFVGVDLCMAAPPTPAVDAYVHSQYCGVPSPDETWTLQSVPGGTRLVSEGTGECATIQADPTPPTNLVMQPCGGPGQVFVISPTP